MNGRERRRVEREDETQKRSKVKSASEEKRQVLSKGGKGAKMKVTAGFCSGEITHTHIPTKEEDSTPGGK